MNLPELHRQLISAARQAAPDEHVPYAFEKRITALIKDRVAQKNQDFWVRGLWRAALSCVAIAVMCGAWAMFSPARSGATTDDFSQNFENTLLATVDQSDATP
jgi:anti-sigma-K factor RskA